MRRAVLPLLLSACPAAAAERAATSVPPPPPASALARQFGALPAVADISLSPDGRFVAYVTPMTGSGTEVRTLDTFTGRITRVLSASGRPLRITACGWAAETRLACKVFARGDFRQRVATISRLVSVNWDGSGRRFLTAMVGVSPIHTMQGGRESQYDGDVMDWRVGNGSMLVIDGGYSVSTRFGDLPPEGFGVNRLDAATGSPRIVETSHPAASLFLSDDAGKVRIRGIDEFDTAPDPSYNPDRMTAFTHDPKSLKTDDRARDLLTGNPDGDFIDDEDGFGDDIDYFNGVTRYEYRQPGSKRWLPFSTIKPNDPGMLPIAVDGTRNVAYAIEPRDGRAALYRVSLDGKLTSDVASASPSAEVTGVLAVGRQGHVIGATYDTVDARVDYFDSRYRDLAAGLSRQLPGGPAIRFAAADAAERKMVVLISGGTDPGHYDLYDSKARSADNWLESRPALRDAPLAPARSIEFGTAGGATLHAMLTVPAGPGRNLPAIVLPRGGDYRDPSGFDWLAQYFVQRGFAVIQPALRGSTEAGDAWYVRAGTDRAAAVSDARAAGRWLVAQGIADPARMAAVGWSWGGYAALEASVADPALFKAVVAIAPVTDVPAGPTVVAGSDEMVAEAGVVAGSPIGHAGRITAPVLLFHGAEDVDVSTKFSRELDAALRRAGRRSELVVFPRLDHRLADADARAAMLDRADAFLRAAFSK